MRCNIPRLFGAWVIHAITGSHYDHVGIILRFGDTLKDLYILEAVGKRGVRMIQWLRLREMLFPGAFFEKIVTRKLIYEKN